MSVSVFYRSNFSQSVWQEGVLSTYIFTYCIDDISKIIYLGCILKYHLTRMTDYLIRCVTLSIGNFAFYSANINALYFVFLQFCTSFNGAKLWVSRSKCWVASYNMSVSYHCSLKNILRLPMFLSNHLHVPF